MLVTLSQRHDVERLMLKAARKLYVHKNFMTFLTSFGTSSQHLQTPEDHEHIPYEMIRRLSWQGVRHAEVYVAVGSVLKFKSMTIEEVTAAV